MVSRPVVVDGQPDARVADAFLGPGQEAVFGRADDDTHACCAGVGEGAVDLGFARHVDDAAAVHSESEAPGFGDRRAYERVRSVEREMQVLEADAAKPEAPGHGQGRVEVELSERVGGQAELEGRRGGGVLRREAVSPGRPAPDESGRGARRDAEKCTARDPCHSSLL